MTPPPRPIPRRIPRDAGPEIVPVDPEELLEAARAVRRAARAQAAARTREARLFTAE